MEFEQNEGELEYQEEDAEIKSPEPTETGYEKIDEEEGAGGKKLEEKKDDKYPHRSGYSPASICMVTRHRSAACKSSSSAARRSWKRWRRLSPAFLRA